MVERTYYKNGNISSERYLKNNKLHREDGPVLIRYYQNGNIYEEKYYENGNILCEMYLINGMAHRLNGAAHAEYFENWEIDQQYYFIDDIEYEEFEYYVKVGILNGSKKNSLL